MKQYLKYLLFTVVAAIAAMLIASVPEMWGYLISGLRSLLTMCGMLGAFGLVHLCILYAVSLNRVVCAIALPVYLLAGAAISYYRIAFHVAITPLMIDCIVHTNGAEAASVISWGLALALLVPGLVALLLVVWRWRLQAPRYAWLHALVAISLLGVFFHTTARMRQALNQHFPANVVYSTGKYLEIEHLRSLPHTVPASDCVQDVDSLTVVFVLGESLRADHLALNGYNRPTTPLLEQRTNLLSFPYVYSEYTSTHTSVPVIITRADSLHPERQFTESSFCSVFCQHDFYTAWLSNHEPNKTFALAPSECDTALMINAGKSVFVNTGWYDEEMLPHLDRLLAQEQAKKMIVVHAIGSHWYYDNHYTPQFRQFAPTTESRVITGNTAEMIVNSYDNSVLYTDFFLDAVISRLQESCAIMIFLSDHGESLGEGGRWLHANEETELKNPACMVWYSDGYAEQFPEKLDALQSNCKKRYKTDFLFPSLLSAAGLQTDESDSSLDIFSTY